MRKICLKLEDDYDSELASFPKYVDSNWIGELNPCAKLRRRPAFAHSLWNKFEATLQGKMRTNNVVEGYNHAFGLSLPSRATDWTVIDRFHTEDATIKTLGFTRLPLAIQTRKGAGPSRGLPGKNS